MCKLLTPLLFLITHTLYAQVIVFTYQEELEFAYRAEMTLAEQWDQLIWKDWSYGYNPDQGWIRYTFNFDEGWLSREERSPQRQAEVLRLEIDTIISRWNPQTQHFTVCAQFRQVPVCYELTQFETGELTLLIREPEQPQQHKEPMPLTDWPLWRWAQTSTPFGEPQLQVEPPN